MKKYAIAVMALVLVGAFLTGCGCTNSAVATQPTATKPATMPTTMPATEPVKPAQTTPATEPVTVPSEPASTSGSDVSEETGMPETTEPMTRESGRVRSHINGDF